MAKRRRLTVEFKARVPEEALSWDRTVQQIVARHRLHPSQVFRWERTASERLTELF